MIEHTTDEVIGSRNDLTQARLEIVILSKEKDVLKVDSLQMGKKIYIDKWGRKYR